MNTDNNIKLIFILYLDTIRNYIYQIIIMTQLMLEKYLIEVILNLSFKSYKQILLVNKISHTAKSFCEFKKKMLQ